MSMLKTTGKNMKMLLKKLRFPYIFASNLAKLLILLKQKDGPRRQKYRQYSPTTLTTALNKIRNKKITIYKACRVFQIPKTTLLDRVSGRVDPETVKSGPDPVLSIEQEAMLSGHIKKLALYGHG